MRFISSLLVALMAVGGALAFGAVPADAAPIVIFDEAAFLAANDIVSTEQFETQTVFPAEQKTVVFQQVQFTSTDTANPSWETASPTFREKTLVRAFRDGPDEHADILIDFADQAATSAIGFHLSTGSVGDNFFELIVVEVGGVETTIALPPDERNTYIGITSGVGIVSVTITQRQELSGGLANYHLDNVSRGVLVPPTATCLGHLVTIVGTDGDDELIGTAGDDVIVGLAGRDLIRGMGGNDVICGGDGRDRIYGNGGDDQIDGGAGDDVISGNRGADVVDGGDGNDLLKGSSGDDTLRGGPGDDRIFAGGGNDTAYGDTGNDIIAGNNGTDTCEGGPGDNTIRSCE